MSWQKCKFENVIDNVITVLNLQEPMEKRFIVNYGQKVSEQEKGTEDM